MSEVQKAIKEAVQQACLEKQEPVQYAETLLEDHHIVVIKDEHYDALQVIADARFGGNFQECLEQAIQNAIILWAKQAKRQHPEITKTRFSPDRPQMPETSIGGLTE